MGTETNTARTPRTVMIIGDPDRAEMQSLIDWIRNQRLSSAIQLNARDIPAALSQCAADRFPDLVIVLQSWPLEFPAAQISELLAFTPLSRIVVCYGAWCESDGRNQNPPLWPIAVRVPVWSAASRIEREWRLINEESARQALPWSASREEVFAADHSDVTQWQLTQPIWIDSPDPDYQRFLRELIAIIGDRITADAPATILFDADPWGPERISALHLLKNQHPAADIIALTSLCHADQAAELHSLGVAAIENKLGIRLLNVQAFGCEDVPIVRRN